MSLSRRKSKQPFGWVSALLFNAVLLAFAYVTGLLIVENKRALGEEFVTTSEAVTATRQKMSEMFAALVPDGTPQRDFWAKEINRQLAEEDIITARGLLLAAPAMLNKKDAGAVLVAAETETSGRLDDRLLSAATLFLPDDVRARYERVTAPGGFETLLTELDGDDADTENIPVENEDSPDNPDQASERAIFSVLGSERDLAYLTAGWLRGDRTDVFSLSVSGLGLAAKQNKFETAGFSGDVLRGASLLKSARRAGRLQPEFERLLEDRLRRALPPDRLKTELAEKFTEGGSILIQSDTILSAFVDATDETQLDPFLSDLERLAQLAEGRSHSSALILMETLSSLRDLKRAELLAFAGGDRAVALAKYYGPDSLSAAQTVLDWTMTLIILIMTVAGLLALLIWLSAATFFRSLGRRDSFGSQYGGYR